MAKTQFEKVVETGKASHLWVHPPGSQDKTMTDYEIAHWGIKGNYTGGGKLYLDGNKLFFDADGNYIGHGKGGCIDHKSITDCPCANTFVASKLEDLGININ